MHAARVERTKRGKTLWQKWEEYVKVDWGLEPKPIVRVEAGVKGFVAISASFRGREMASTIH